MARLAGSTCCAATFHTTITDHERSNFVNAIWKLIAAVLLAIVLLPSRARAQHSEAPMQIVVQVRMPDGSAATQGLLCEMDLENTEMLDQGQTDSSGKCHFVPQGHNIYVIRIKGAGYLEVRERVDLQNSSTWYGSITLRPDPRAAPPTAQPGAPVSAVDLSVPEAARKEFDAATQSLQNHDLDAGIAHLKKAIELHDQYPQAYTMLGTAYNQQKKWKDAHGALQKAIQLEPKEADAYFQLGATLNQEKDFAGAEKALTQGFQLLPEPPEGAAAHYELAYACFMQGRWQDAEPHAAKTIAAHPEFAMAHWLLAQIMLKKGDGQGAINEFQTYLKLDPNGPAAPSVRAVIPKIQAAIAKK
jgi:Tfp pilus assembly protein PilF